MILDSRQLVRGHFIEILEAVPDDGQFILACLAVNCRSIHPDGWWRHHLSSHLACSNVRA